MKGFTQDVEAIWFEGSAGSGSSTVPRELPAPLLKEVDEQLKSQMQEYTSPTKSDSTD
jgi:adenylylsulfate kinase-like enzyme